MIKLLKRKGKKEPIQPNSKSQIDDVVNVWNTPEIPMILSLYDEEKLGDLVNLKFIFSDYYILYLFYVLYTFMRYIIIIYKYFIDL